MSELNIESQPSAARSGSGRKSSRSDKSPALIAPHRIEWFAFVPMARSSWCRRRTAKPPRPLSTSRKIRWTESSKMLRTRTGLPKHCVWNVDRGGKRRRVCFRLRGVTAFGRRTS